MGHWGQAPRGGKPEKPLVLTNVVLLFSDHFLHFAPPPHNHSRVSFVSLDNLYLCSLAMALWGQGQIQMGLAAGEYPIIRYKTSATITVPLFFCTLLCAFQRLAISTREETLLVPLPSHTGALTADRSSIFIERAFFDSVLLCLVYLLFPPQCTLVLFHSDVQNPGSSIACSLSPLSLVLAPRE